jgi:dipicolinate synthase subunit A
VVVLPLPGTSSEGVIRAVYAEQELKLTEKTIAALAPHALVMIGTAREFLKKWWGKGN